MSQPVTYNSSIDGATSRRYTGFPLNSTLVSSYTPDTIRSIITHAAAGQPYSTAVWIRLSRVGIQINAQDTQIARARIPVFIPIGLTHDIFMLPSINNVICIVYDEVQSNMKGILLYIVHPSDAQFIRDDFRIIKQAHNSQQQTPSDNHYSNPNEVYPSEPNQAYTSLSSRKSPFTNNQTIRQPSPRRVVYVQDNETNYKRETTPTLPQLSYTPTKSNYHSDHQRHKSPRRNRSGPSPTKRSSDNAIKYERNHKSRSPERQAKTKLPVSSSSPNLAKQQIQLEQQQQQQQQAAWQATQQQLPLIPMGIYNRYVPKTIPLPTGETLKTTLPPPGSSAATMNGAAMAYIEPIVPANVRIPSRSRSNSPAKSPQRHQQNRLPTGQSIHRHHHRRHHNNDNPSQSIRIRSKNTSTKNDSDDETKYYLKMLMEEMQAMKIEMNKLRQIPSGTSKGRSDSIQTDLKDIRSHIETLRAGMALSPRMVNK